MSGERIIAIDPGPRQSGYCVFDPAAFQVITCRNMDNIELFEIMTRSSNWSRDGDTLVIEKVAHYGMRVGKEVFDTCTWAGIYAAKFGVLHTFQIPFATVSMTICHRRGAKEADVWRVVRDMFPKSGGGLSPEIGTKSKPGPLYKTRAQEHGRSALAVAITHGILMRENAEQHLRDYSMYATMFDGVIDEPAMEPT